MSELLIDSVESKQDTKKAENSSKIERSEHLFDQAVTLVAEDGAYKGRVSKHYQNMVGPFGGITAAQIIQSILDHPDREGMPVSLTLNYLGAMSNAEFEIKPYLLKTNRSNQHWRVELWQDGALQISATCVFAQRKATWGEQESRGPDAPDAESLEPFTAFSGMIPWVNQYDFRFVHGGPFQQNDPDIVRSPSESLLWVSDKPERKIDFASLTALADSFFPRIIIKRQKMVPFGTVSMTINFHVTESELEAIDETRLLGHARASKFNNGFFEQTAELWTSRGQLVASTSQMVYYKD